MGAGQSKGVAVAPVEVVVGKQGLRDDGEKSSVGTSGAEDSIGSDRRDDATVPKATTTTTSTAPTTTQAKKEGACPYKGPFAGWGSGKKSSFDQVHGKGGAMPLGTAGAAKEAQKEGACPYKGPFAGWGGGSKEKMGDKEASPPTRADEKESSSACPYRGGDDDRKKKKEKPIEYNVYSQPITEEGRLAAVGNNLPNPRQKQSLSTHRVQSTIPKGNTDDDDDSNDSTKTTATTTWTYPSPQMFYNALARKNKLTDDTREEDMESVVAIHNNMNERTWAKILQWEALADPTGKPKLLKFRGRPSDLSLKAGVKHYLLHHPLPFDRHDWTVQRGDGTEVRYIIDYYHNDREASTTSESALPALHDFHSIRSIVVDVRPAVETPRDVWARCWQMPWARWNGTSTFEPLPLVPSASLATQVEDSQETWKHIQETVRQSKQRASEADAALPSSTTSTFSPATFSTREQAQEMAQSFAQAVQACRQAQRAVDGCVNDETCTRASLDLTMCMGVYLCPVQHQALLNVLSSENEKDDDKVYGAKFETAIENLTLCVGEANQMAQQEPQAVMASSSSSSASSKSS